MTDFSEILKKIENMLFENDRNITVAIDGRCASGKTTLAAYLAEHFDCNIIHMDDFFLQSHQRTKERYNTPGGNFDIERFKEEIITSIGKKSGYSYSPFDCKSMSLCEKITLPDKRLTVFEGTYSCHPDFCGIYDLRIFLSTDKNTQRNRILTRNPDKAEMFFSKWIILEEKYFSHFDIEDKCDIKIET